MFNDAHVSNGLHARLGIYNVCHDGFLVKVAVAVELEAAGMDVVRSRVAEIVNTEDLVAENLDELLGTAPAEGAFLAIEEFLSSNQHVIALDELRQLAAKGSSTQPFAIL